ncbi:LysR family transcriptional regulator [Acidovorax sp. 62]|uniref:LysR family transcriptional regulator n=1 Tax=Acidovorax sp. 62 TaxID=2035203 RepID=UPI000C19BE1B|nr:LysR family transcriptional regulator [Acidovorax sp. 62]PIF92380.1 LysR family transcriptional regulator [Acidovorax sp. 62]
MAINELRAIFNFAKAAEMGSLRQAAAAQGITPQASSQLLGQLESHLGVRLFHRTTRSLSLTEEGRQFLASAQPGLATLQQAIQGARRGGEAMAGPLRIVAPRSILLEVVWPVITEFCRRHPQVEPDVQLDDRIGNWVEDRVDVGFRSGYPPEGGVVARRLLSLQLIVCASPAYIARHGAPTCIADLALHRCSGFRHAATGKPMPWEFQVGDDIVARDILPAFCTNDIEVEARAVLGGHAVGQLVGTTAAPLVRSGHLVPLLPQHVAQHLGLYVYYGNRKALPERVRAFIDLAVEMLANNPAYALTPQELGLAQAEPVRTPRARQTK